MSSDQSKKSNIVQFELWLYNLFKYIFKNQTEYLYSTFACRECFFFSESERFIWMNIPLKSVQGFANVLREAKMSISHILK